MRFFTAVLAAITLSAPVLAGPITINEIKKVEGQKTGKYIVKLKDVSSMSNFMTKLTDKAKITNNWEFFHGFAGFLDDADLNTLRGSSDVEYIEEEGYMSISATQKDAPWGLSRLSSAASLNGKSASALDFEYTFDDSAGKGVDIYVVDTGIRTTHSEFGGRARWGKTFGGYPDSDGNGHGTHCAGTVAGTKFGVAKAANVIAVKVLSDAGSGTNSDILSGINWVVSEAEASGRPSVMSMSLGGGASRAVDDAVNRAAAAGIHVVVAAGNEGRDAKTTSPARAAGAITIGASDINDQLANFSNFGSVVALLAPGVNIISAGIESDTATATQSGTSMATPHVAGLVGYLIGLEGNVAPTAMKAKLQTLALKDAITGVRPGTVNLLARNAK